MESEIPISIGQRYEIEIVKPNKFLKLLQTAFRNEKNMACRETAACHGKLNLCVFP